MSIGKGVKEQDVSHTLSTNDEIASPISQIGLVLHRTDDQFMSVNKGSYESNQHSNRDDQREEGDDEDVPSEDSDAEVENLLHGGRELHPPAETEKELPSFEMRHTRARHGGSSSSVSSPSDSVWTKLRRRLGFRTMSRLERLNLSKEMMSQILPILLLSLGGSIVTGSLLERLEDWRVFIRIEELFILVPILLNLKGNLEMNLAARFSTSANIGELDLRLTRRSLIVGNLALLQVQALLVSLLSGLLAFVLGMLSRNGIHHNLQHPIHNPNNPTHSAAGGADVTDALRGGYFEALLVLCVSMLAASISSAVLGAFMCSTVVLCRRYHINPDNVATPLAAALGDLVTLVILSGLSTLFAMFMGTLVSTAVFLLLLGSVLVNVLITYRNAYVQELLTIGWAPLFVAMGISSASGLLLETYVNEYKGFGLLSMVLNGLSGNAGSIFVSRISTSLHSNTKGHHMTVAIALFGLSTPVLLGFLVFVWFTGMLEVSILFAVAVVIVICLQIIIALLLAYHLSVTLWKWDFDPDVYAIPLLSSFLDVTGQLMLVLAYAINLRYSGPSTSSATVVILL